MSGGAVPSCVLESSANPTLASRQAWGLVLAVLLLYLLLRWVAGPLPQWLDYHDFADTRLLGFVPRAGDVLTNLAILAAGLWAASLRHRVYVGRDERPAFRLLVTGAILTAFGSAYYHWEPSNARLVWDRLPLALLLTAIVSLVLADRVTPAFGRAALLPVGSLAVGSVAPVGSHGSIRPRRPVALSDRARRCVDRDTRPADLASLPIQRDGAGLDGRRV